MPTKIPEVTGFIIYGLLLKLHDLKNDFILRNFMNNGIY